MKDHNLPGRKRILLGPGPSPVNERVLRAMSEPLLGHLDPLFLEMMDEIQDLLRYVFETGNRLTIPVSGTGSAGMEAALINVLEPGDKAVVCIHGVFGERMFDIVGRMGAQPIAVQAEWGQPVDMNRIEDAVRQARPKVLAIVHAETSTGVLQHLEGLSDLARRHDALLVVELPAGAVANHVFTASGRAHSVAPAKGPELVSGHDDDRKVLGVRSELSSHGADLNELWPARSIAAGTRRGVGSPPRAPSIESPRVRCRDRSDGA
jgi:hypothetical protein